MAERLRLTKQIVNVAMRLTIHPDAHVPDTLTRIRVLPTVAVVGQKDRVKRTEKGYTSLDVYVKYLPVSKGGYKSIVSLSKLVKGIPGVKIVTVISVGGKLVTYKGNPIVL